MGLSKVHLRKLVKACQSLLRLAKPINCESLRKTAKNCETILANLCCKCLRKSVKSYLRTLAKPKYFCESIVAKACENTCILHSLILAKKRFAKTYCKTLRKVYLLLSPPLLRARHRTRLLSLVILHFFTMFTLFAITILKPIGENNKLWLPLLCLPQILRYPGMPSNLWRNLVTQLFQEHEIVCNLPDLKCSQTFFSFKSLSSLSRYNRISASLIQLPLDVSQFPQIDLDFGNGIRKKTLSAIERNLTDSRLIVPLWVSASKIEPASFAILQQIRNSTGWSVKQY